MRRLGLLPPPQIRTRKDQRKTEITEAAHLMYTFGRGGYIYGSENLSSR